jgi:nucleoid-associated protein YgaU
VAAAEALLAKAEQAFAAGDYAAALDSQAQAEAEAQRALAAQPDYAAVTPGLNEIKASLGQVVTRIRDARVAGRVKDDDPIAKGQGLAATFAGLGIRYNRDLLPAWVKGASPQLRNDVEKLRKGVVELQAAMDKELGPPTR